MKIELICPDERMPRTEYWAQMLKSIETINCEATGPEGMVYMPAEDIAVETNWPRYARGATAYLRGQGHNYSPQGETLAYIQRLAAWASENRDKRLLIVNMHPFVRLPFYLRQHANIYIADGCLSGFDRCVNPRTISMPALPVNTCRAVRTQGRTVFASFQGMPSHPVRRELLSFHDSRAIVIVLTEKNKHEQLRLDASRGVGDADYQALLERSVFAFVPRGDALFSYRLLEVLSFGCIPIILSDGWVLPLDRTVRWSDVCYSMHREALTDCMNFLKEISIEEVSARRERVMHTYTQHFAELTTIMIRVLAELDALPQA